MRKRDNVSMAVVRRLPKYYRYLRDLLSKDINKVSSSELSRLTGFTASQIRQDLNNFGGFGQQGYGYNVSELHNQLSKILGLNKSYNAVIVGAGNLGQAIGNYGGLQEAGLNLLTFFDKSAKMIGLRIGDLEIRDVSSLERFIEENNVEVGIITTPTGSAQAVADLMVNKGIKGIWNFAEADLKVPDHVMVENVHLNESLFTLSYLIEDNDLDD
ncbi:redox-sensing transcriptional repressor Rex [Sporosalibacterium faouarense]|uniref:redox-sensing transcriptional repressor Rex n=1 Tax=Sporosalibacterium faouarense TaxID=516123 RepID=UPI00141CD557|nr:redox-sensing transcriptional repressor Rex [Sporosalibacterium faouarense]MTI46757.1 redox-sensing transcriptional repressor Rex [Bacillota bacterium]